MSRNSERITFEYMYQKYKNTIYLMIGKVISDTDLKNDCMQEIFMKYYKSMSRVKGEQDSRRWLLAIAHNTIIDMSKKDTVYKSRVTLVQDEREIINAINEIENVPLDNVLKTELANKVADIIEHMKPIHREVIQLKYYLELSPKDMAKLLEISVNTVYSRLRRAEEIIHSEIARYAKDKK